MNKKYFKKIELSEIGRNSNWRRNMAEKHSLLSQKLISTCKKISICPICSSENRTIYIEVYGFKYYNCNDCNHLYSGLIPSAKVLRSLYAETTASSKIESSQREIYTNEKYFEKRLNEIAFPKAKFVSDRIKDRGLWIDLGAGVGDLLISAEKLGWETLGFESDRLQVQFSKNKGVNMIEKYLDLEKPIKELKKAKIVSLINVLEHLENPKQTIINISKSMASGGYFLFEVPRFPSISSFANKCFPETSARNIYSPDHLHLFSDDSINLILEKAGFQIASVWYFGQDMYELFGNAACKGKFELNSSFHDITRLINDFQKIVDSNKLSDTMLMLVEKK